MQANLKKINNIICVILSLSLLSNCAGHRTNEKQLELADFSIPNEFEASKKTMGDDVKTITNFSEINGWIHEFNDETLIELVKDAYENSPDYLSRLERLKSSKEFLRIAPLSFAPGASLSANKTNTSVIDTTGERVSTDSFGATISADWEVDIWGKLVDEYRGQLLSYDSADAAHRATELLLVANLARAWYGLSTLDMQLKLTERSIENSKNNLDVTERRYNLGIANAVDVRLARSALSSSQANFISQTQSLEDSKRLLQINLGRYPDANIEFPSGLPNIKQISNLSSDEIIENDELPTIKPINIKLSPEDVLKRRPDIIAAEANLRKAQIDVSVARKAFLPQIKLTATFSNNSDTSISDALDIDNTVRNIVLGLTQPIFQRGRLFANARSKEKLANAALYDYLNVVLNAFKEVEDGITAESLLLERLEFLNENYIESTNAEELIIEKYRSGTATIFELLLAQNRQLQSESDLIRAKFDYIQNRINLYLALGGAAFNDDEKINNQIARKLHSKN